MSVVDSIEEDSAVRRSELVSMLFPAGAVASELRGRPRLARLHPAELARCAKLAPKRAAEFAAGRLCARHALASFAFFDFPLEVKPDRTPQWPEEVVGSISHTSGFACAVVGAHEDFRALGVDAEGVGRVTTDLWAQLFTKDECALLRSAPPSWRDALATVMFSAKESFYKCQFPVTGAWVDFHDVQIQIGSGSGADRGELLAVPLRPFSLAQLERLEGRFAIQEISS